MRVLVDVVVPARDEQERIGACLTGLLEAMAVLRSERPQDDARITLVLDDCHDRTALVARSVLDGVPSARVLETSSRAVGAARAAGVADALARSSDRTEGAPSAGAPGTAVRWLAATDADSVVPPGWLVQQADACRAGADVLVGGVVPDPADLDADALRRWRAVHAGDEALGHVHGANLGIGADAYLFLGGFEAVTEHEDVGLVARARAAGLSVRATLDAPVTTSGRFSGRTPGGYAEHLRATYTGPVPSAGLP